MTFEATKPAFQGGSIAIWHAKDKNGKPYLKVKLFGHVTNCFKVEDKVEVKGESLASSSDLLKVDSIKYPKANMRNPQPRLSLDDIERINQMKYDNHQAELQYEQMLKEGII